MNKRSGLVCGILILVIGAGLILSATGLVQDVFFDGWWSLFLIVPGLVMIYRPGSRIPGILIVLLGIYFLLKAQNVIQFSLSFPMILGIVLVILGLKLLIPKLSSKSSDKTFSGEQAEADETSGTDETGKSVRIDVDMNASRTADTSKNAEYTALFNRVDASNSSRALKNCTANAVFAPVYLDLHGAEFKDKSRLELNGVFGEVQVLLPSNARYRIDTHSVFGAVTTHFLPEDDPDLPLCKIDANAVFGGVQLYRQD